MASAIPAPMPATAILAWLGVYAAGAITLAVLFGGRNKSSSDFLHTDRDVPLWVLSISFLAANCSAFEVLTVIATSAKYGVAAVHFYWIGAIPALVFLICVILPLYERARIRTLPEFFELRFNRATRATAGMLFCLMMIAIAGLTICVFSRLVHLAIGLSYASAIWPVTALLALFLALGGITTVIYGEAIQLALFFLVLIPLSFSLLRQCGGLGGLLARLPQTARHPLAGLPAVSIHTSQDSVGVLLGLGLVLGFSYWCGDLLLAQRLLAARNRREMAQTPATALVAKLVLPMILVVPGLAFSVLYPMAGVTSYDMALPNLLASHYSPGIFALAIAALLMSLFICMAGNLQAAVTIFTYDLYRSFLRKDAADAHYSAAGRLAAIGMPLLAAGAAYLAFASNSLMEYLQLVLAVLSVPLATTMLLGMLTSRISQRSGVPAILAGAGAGVVHSLLAPYLHYGSGLTKAYYGAILAAAVTTATAVVLSLNNGTVSRPPVHLRSVVVANLREEPGLALLCLASLGACGWLYWFFR